MSCRRIAGALLGLVTLLLLQKTLLAQPEKLFPVIFPEARVMQLRAPAELPRIPLPQTERPWTVSAPPSGDQPHMLSLDEMIRTGLTNFEVVRVLAGSTAPATGRTVYDVAISQAAIDRQQSVLDPDVTVNNQFFQQDTPTIPAPPGVLGSQADGYNLNVGVRKPTITGGTLDLGLQSSPMARPGISQTPTSVDLGFTQPLLQGGGRYVTLAPIVLARIETERSFFQFKDGVEEFVRGIVEGYWRLVLARTNAWVRQQQVEQLEEAYNQARAQLQVGRADLELVSQTRVALSNFRATLIGAEAEVLDREAALRNIVGFPVYDPNRLVPTSPPSKSPFAIEWNSLVALAAEQRADIIELKLILEADQQQLLLAENQAFPRVDAQGLYRWNGLDGEVPAGGFASRPGQFTDWTLSVNFSVPLGLRAARASLRSRELTISRDRANLDAAVLDMTYVLASSLRNLDLFYEQYLVFQETREAARINLEVQVAAFRNGQVIFLNVLQAIADWGNTISSEAQLLLQYNIELANLERRTGTILQTHGIRFYEEQFGSIGPLGRWHSPRFYPDSVGPTLNGDIYESGDVPAEESFDLTVPELRRRGERLPPPQ
jgi:outer membrane protein TolC